MRRWINIFVFVFWATMGVAQETRIVDSLQAVLATQEGREKVLTMIELTWDFYDVSFDDCISWGEKAIKEAHATGFSDLEAKANYVLGIQYGYHGDFDLAREYLQKAYNQFDTLSDIKNVFESLWHLATYELTLGSVDTANMLYDKALSLAMSMDDSTMMAHIISNKAIIQYQKNEPQKAMDSYRQVKRIADRLSLEEMSIQAESNIATIAFETGNPEKARSILNRLIPKLEADSNHYLLTTVYQTLGMIHERTLVNFDSAMYCYEKALYHSGRNVALHANQASMRQYRCDILSRMANISYRRDEFQKAVEEYDEALRQSETENYRAGQLKAHMGLGQVYAHMGQAAKSLYHLTAADEIGKATGIMAHKASLKVPLILDYARLGRFDDLETELQGIIDDKAALAREIADLYDRNRELEETVENLAVRLEQQDLADEAQQAQLKRYRLAFFGLLSIALFAIALLVAREIVRKNRGKSA